MNQLLAAYNSEIKLSMEFMFDVSKAYRKNIGASVLCETKNWCAKGM